MISLIKLNFFCENSEGIIIIRRHSHKNMALGRQVHKALSETKVATDPTNGGPSGISLVRSKFNFSKSTTKFCAQYLHNHHRLLMFSMDGSGNCGVLTTQFQSILAEGHQVMVTLRDGVYNIDDKGMSFRERVSKYAKERFAKGCALFKNLP